MKKNINLNISLSRSDIKFLLKPVGFFVVASAFLVGVLMIGIKQIKSINQKLQDSRKTQATLTKNVNVLRTVDSEISDKQDFIEVALPEDFASVYFVSQIKNLSFEYGLLLSNIRTGINVDSGKGLSKSSISFDVEGSNNQISSYIDALTNVLPLGNVTKVKTVASGALSRSSLTVEVYSAKLPEKIPSIEAPVVSLTNDEKELLISLTKYTLPSFIKPAASVNTSPREDPFQ